MSNPSPPIEIQPPCILLSSQGSHRQEKYLNFEGFLEKSLKIKSALKSTGKLLKALKSPGIILFSVGLSTVGRELNQYKSVVHMLHQKEAQQFCTNFPVLMSPLSQSSISEVEF